MMCLAHVNDNHFMIVYLKVGCPIHLIFVLCAQHYRDAEKSWDARYAHKMIVYNELSRTTDNKIIGDNDLFIVENLEPQEKLLLIRRLEMESRLKMKALNLMIVAYNLGQIS